MQYILMPEGRERLVRLKKTVAERFTAGHWSELGVLTGCEGIIDGHPRLLRALHFQDPDYEPLILPVLSQVVTANPLNLGMIERYVAENFAGEGENISTAPSKGRTIVFTPSVFEVPDDGLDPGLVAVMMPFAAHFEPIFGAIQAACYDASLRCVRVKDIWDHSVIIQDVFSLIFRAQVVVCDFTDKNPNVFYEAGIAHTLGKHVVPLSQHTSDVPFDLSHHRYLQYLNNGEGLVKLRADLSSRLKTIAPNPDLHGFSF